VSVAELALGGAVSRKPGGWSSRAGYNLTGSG
jgi:hypothetical protein